jgi:CPA1 family monovalent cation:H+ antiporter
MDLIETYVALFGIIVTVGFIFDRSVIPTSLILVITGMILSHFLILPTIDLNPKLVLDVFLPLLLYQISTSSSWKDFKKNLRPIALMSVGHVLFMTCLVAVTVHWLLPELGWPLAFVLGAVISPPDDVAIVSIAEKIHMPKRLVTILEGEGMLNDATALILFRFALAATLTHEFSALAAVSTFFIVLIGETLYGLFLGYVIGNLRLRIHNPIIHMITSVLTPFLAYLPAERLGGCGVIATVVTGLVIGHHYSLHFQPEFRLLSRAVWPTLSFAIQSLLFLLVGLNMQFILHGISAITFEKLAFYTLSVVGVVVIGRFIWVYPATYLPRYWFASIRKRDPYPPWQNPFLISWAGMRGSISLAAALAVPVLPGTIDNVNVRNLIIFLVFSVIVVTLVVQGLTLPWLLKTIGIGRHTQREKYDEHLEELHARVKINKAVLRWLEEYNNQVINDPKLAEEVQMHLKYYKLLNRQLQERLSNHDGNIDHDERLETIDTVFLLSHIIKIEKSELLRLWRNEKISLSIRNKLLDNLDYRSKYVSL